MSMHSSNFELRGWCPTLHLQADTLMLMAPDSCKIRKVLIKALKKIYILFCLLCPYVALASSFPDGDASLRNIILLLRQLHQHGVQAEEEINLQNI